MFTEGPEVQYEVFEFDWGQPELAAQRRQNVFDGWISHLEGDNKRSQSEFSEADRILSEMLENNGVHPNRAARVKYSVIVHELQYLRKFQPGVVNLD